VRGELRNAFSVCENREAILHPTKRPTNAPYRIFSTRPTIGEQCIAQGLVTTGMPIEMIDRISHALTLAHIHGCLTDSEINRARKRLFKASKFAVTPQPSKDTPA
jgi:hypothetical protein